MGTFDPCPCCGKEAPMTRHHILPRRHFGRKNNREVFLLCRSCHNALERRIPQATKLEPDEYRRILQQFVGSFR